MSILKDFDEIYDHAHMWNWGPDWLIVKNIYIRFPDSYSVLTPFVYTYFEELIRSTTSEYGLPFLDGEGKKNNLKVGIKLINLAIAENNDKVDYIKLLEKAKKHFRYAYDNLHEENGRNKVLHGHLHPRFWGKDDFETLIHDIAEMSQYAGF